MPAATEDSRLSNPPPQKEGVKTFYTCKTHLESEGEGLQTFQGLVDSVNHLLGGDVGEGLRTFQWMDSWAKMRVRVSGQS